MQLTLKQRAKLVEEIENATRKRVGTDVVTPSLQRSCLWYAYETIVALERRGIRSVLQAGSASWLIVPDELDDGVSPTHYSYVFEGNMMEVLVSIERVLLPEMHVWAAIVETNEVIDLTTKYIAELAELAGCQCKVKQPDYIWEDVHALAARGIYYKPTKPAIALAHHLIAETL